VQRLLLAVHASSRVPRLLLLLLPLCPSFSLLQIESALQNPHSHCHLLPLLQLLLPLLPSS
jgi:hypothetical protein